jgi:hypothetical protein
MTNSQTYPLRTEMSTPPEQGKWYDVILAGGGFIALLKFAQWLLARLFDRRRKTRVIEGIEELSRFYSTMEQCLSASCGRVLLLAAHNSGGVPTATAPFYTSAIHWATATPDQRRMISGYHNIKVDDAYIKMLLKIHTDGVYHFKMDENEGSMLRAFYEAEGVTDSVLVFLTIQKNQFLYMSFASFGQKFTPLEITRFRLTANTIKNLVEK